MAIVDRETAEMEFEALAEKRRLDLEGMNVHEKKIVEIIIRAIERGDCTLDGAGGIEYFSPHLPDGCKPFVFREVTGEILLNSDKVTGGDNAEGIARIAWLTGHASAEIAKIPYPDLKVLTAISSVFLR